MNRRSRDDMNVFHTATIQYMNLSIVFLAQQKAPEVG